MRYGHSIVRLLCLGIMAASFMFVGTASADLTDGLVAYYPSSANVSPQGRAIYAEAPTFKLTVIKAGTGSGTIQSNPFGISCPGDCSQRFSKDEQVTLTATPDADSTFIGWKGACSGQLNCAVTMTTAKRIRAKFVKKTYLAYFDKTSYLPIVEGATWEYNWGPTVQVTSVINRLIII